MENGIRSQFRERYSKKSALYAGIAYGLTVGVAEIITKFLGYPGAGLVGGTLGILAREVWEGASWLNKLYKSQENG